MTIIDIMLYRLKPDKLDSQSKSIPHSKLSRKEKWFLVWMILYTHLLSGFAISAVQLGKPKKLIYVSLPTFPFHVLINLQVIDLAPDKKWLSQEICLSLPGTWELKRPQHIKAIWNDYKGRKQIFETQDLKLIQILCHEYDHSKGILLHHNGRRID